MKSFSFNVEIWQDHEEEYNFGVSLCMDGVESFLAGGMGVSLDEAVHLASEEIKSVFV